MVSTEIQNKQIICFRVYREIMTRLKFFVITLSIIFYSCENNSEEVGIDCSGSDLSIRVIDFVESDCAIPGSVTVEASGGEVDLESDYSYSVNGVSFQESPQFDNLFAGGFNFSVKDKLGCVASISFTLQSEETGITLNLSGEKSNCVSNTGSITAEATGGVGTLRYSLDGSAFSTNTQYAEVSPGIHSVTVKDDDDCEVTKTIQIVTNTSLDSDIMPIISKDCAISGCHNGSIFPRLVTTAEVISNAGRIKSETQSGSMPRNRTLTQTEIDLIACWVDDGALEN